jgi:hypothetical protein
MLFLYGKKIVSLIFVMLILYTILTINIYSSEGDINNILADMKKLEKIGDKDEIVHNLFQIILQEKAKVSWPLILVLSIIFSIIITYCTYELKDLDQKFLITTILIFLPMYLLFNYLKAHGGNKNLFNSILLYKNSKL